MKTRFVFPFLLVACVGPLIAQSTNGITSVASIQSPVTFQPEVPGGPTLGEMTYLPEKLRERQIRTLDNNSFRLSDFQGKVLVINLWASWCGPCRREIPEYEKVRKVFAGRNVEFVGLTREDERNSSPAVSKFLREVSFGFRLGWSDDEMQATLMSGNPTIPQTLVIDGEGHVVSHWVGYSQGHSGTRLKDAIEQALAATHH